MPNIHPSSQPTCIHQSSKGLKEIHSFQNISTNKSGLLNTSLFECLKLVELLLRFEDDFVELSIVPISWPGYSGLTSSSIAALLELLAALLFDPPSLPLVRSLVDLDLLSLAMVEVGDSRESGKMKDLSERVRMERERDVVVRVDFEGG